MAQKRVLIFALVYYPDAVGGAEVALKEITDRIPTEEIIFDMVTLRFNSLLPAFERIGNVNIHRVGFTKAGPSISDLGRLPLVINKYLFPIMGVLKAHSLHRKNPYDGIWAMMANHAGFAALFSQNLEFPSLLLHL